MAFNFFGFKKRHDIEDVVPKEEVPTLPPQEELKADETGPKEIEPPVANELPKWLVTTHEDVIAAYKIFFRSHARV